MAANAHSTPVPTESNTDASQLNRRAALMALPAISGFAALEAAAARAAPVSGLDAAIARMEAATAALKAGEAESWRLEEGIGGFAGVVMGKNSRGEEIYAYSEAEIHKHLDAAVDFWGPDSNARKRLDAKIAEMREAREARLKAERDSGLTACLERHEALCIEYDTAFDDLMAIKPTSIREARRKIAAAMEPLTDRLNSNCDQEDIADILRALI